VKGPLAGRGKKCKMLSKDDGSVGPVCRTAESRGSKSLFLREGLLAFLQGLNERAA
jgi:hypothetical protein